MKVSICITAYNHQEFIASAIESVLMQITDFDFEIIIGEDDSDDKTREIVKQYKKRYPDKIRLFLNDRCNVIYIDGRPTGRWNFVNNITHAKGEYIALLDGDDYWTSTDKIQKQIHFLENNKKYNLCFHDVSILNQETKETTLSRTDFISDTFTVDDLIKNGTFLHTSSVVFRNPCWESFPLWFYSVPMGDYPLFILLSNNSKIYRINESMGVYRKHINGIWSTQKKYKQYILGLNAFRIICKNIYIPKGDCYQRGLEHRYKLIISETKKNKIKYLHMLKDTVLSNNTSTLSNRIFEFSIIMKICFTMIFPNIDRKAKRIFYLLKSKSNLLQSKI